MTFSRLLNVLTLPTFLVTLLLRIAVIFFYNNNLGGIDLNVVYGVQRVLAGDPLYQDPSFSDGSVIQYTPLFYLLAGGLARLLHLSVHHVQQLFVLCRTVALGCNLLMLWPLTALIRQFLPGRRASFVLSLAVLPMLTSHYYTRMDSLHLFLFVSAIWAYFRFRRGGNPGYMLLCALLTALCILAKQSGVLCLGIVGGWLLFFDRKPLLFLVYGLVAAFCTFILLYCVCPDWMILYKNLVLGLKNGIEYTFLFRMFISRYFRDFVPFYILAATAFWLAFRYANPAFRRLVYATVLSWSFAVITGLKIGSSNNYFTEFLVCMLLLYPCLAWPDRLSDNIQNGFRFPAFVSKGALAALFVLLISKTVGFASVVLLEKSMSDNPAQYSRDTKLYGYFTDSLHMARGEHVFFTERRFLDNLFYGNAVFPLPDVVSLVWRADSSTFDYTRFTKVMNSGGVTYVVTDARNDNLNAGNVQLPFIRLDPDCFRVVGRCAGYCIYRYQPKVPPGSPSSF